MWLKGSHANSWQVAQQHKSLSLLLLLLLSFQVKPFQLLPETTKHIFNIIMVSAAVKTLAEDNCGVSS